MAEYPFYDENKDKRYTFYGVLIKDFGDIEDIWDGDIASNLCGYTINEWVFNGFMRFYSKYFNRCTYIEFKYENLTYGEFINIINKDHGVKFDSGDYIDIDTIWMTGETVFSNTSLYELISSYNPDNDEVEQTFIPSIMKAYELFNKCNYFKDSFEIINKLLFRLANIYVTCVILTSYLPIDLDEYKDKRMLIYLTKMANFPRPLEEYEYYDIVCDAYLYKYFLVEHLNYRGE